MTPEASAVLTLDPSDAEALFARHLDLAPLRGRRRGLVRCAFHPNDSRPSLSIDRDRGVFHCFACGVGGGLRRFAELVGERIEAPLSRPARPHSPLSEARARVLAEARRQRVRLEAFRDLYAHADYLRPRHQAVAEVRRVGTVLGDSERAWHLFALAARVQAEALMVESELDELLPLPRQEDLDAPLSGGRL